MELEWQQYILLGLMVIGFISSIHNSYHKKIVEFTPGRVIIGTFSSIVGILLVTSVSLGWAAVILSFLYGLGAILTISKLGRKSKPLEGPVELTTFAIIEILYVWLVLSL